jgi:hypothetical protein
MLALERNQPADATARRGGIAAFAVMAMLSVLLGATAGAAAGDATVGAAPPTQPAWSQRLLADLDGLRSLAGERSEVWDRLPTVRAADRGIAADGKTNVTLALQAALDALTRGGTLVLDRGVYVHSRCLRLRHPDTRIVGRGARLHASNPADMCVALEADGTQIAGLELTARTAARGLGIEQARVVVRGRDTRVLNNRIAGSTSAGIWIEGAADYAIVGNHVSATLADGIYNSQGAAGGLVARNIVTSTGDDGISVVSYRTGAQCARILIEDNEVSNVGWARGISVVGSRDVAIRRNRVTGTGRAAGIIVTREESYNTYGVERVIVADNAVSEVAQRFHYPAREKTGQASIDINAVIAPTPDLRVRQVVVSGNSISDGGTDGIRLLGAVCDVTITDNDIRRLTWSRIAVVKPGCGNPITLCARNTVDDAATLPASCQSAKP